MISVKAGFPMHEGVGVGPRVELPLERAVVSGPVRCVVVCGVQNVWCGRCEKWIAPGRGECVCDVAEGLDGEELSEADMSDLGCFCATGVCEHT